MADPAIEMQRAVIAALKADAGVAALVGARVYDEPPQGPTFPYARLGNLEVAPQRGDGVATASEITFSIEGHSRPAAGRPEAREIAGAVIAALDEADLSVIGHRLVRLFYVTTATVRAADGESYQSNVAFEALLEPT